MCVFVVLYMPYCIVHGVRCGNAHTVGAIPMMVVSACMGWVTRMVA